MRDRRLALIGVAAVLLVFTRETHDESVSVASLSLMCSPVVEGVQCRLLALSHEATDLPRNVTAWASWHAGGSVDLHLLQAEDVVLATGDGDVAIETDYASRRARVVVRLTPNQPGQMLATLRGSIYAYDKGRLEPVAAARVEVVGGGTPWNQTVSATDGTFGFPALVPGDVEIRVTKSGFLPAELTTPIRPGDNRASPVMSIEPPTGNSAL
jgi:hypothetical protein